MEYVLTTDALTKTYRHSRAVDGVSMHVCAALIVKIILLRASVRQILEQAEEKLAEQSNAPISPDSADDVVRRLAQGISRTLDETIVLGRKYREGDAELKRAVTNVSHDLRTPLTSAAGYAGLLKKSGLTPKQAEYLSVIEGRISAMRRLTEELLAYSVAASDETEPVLAEVDVAAALEDSLTQFYAAFEERGISPSIDIPQNEVVRIADKDAPARVFGNVISNAVCYSDGDFCVTMKENGHLRKRGVLARRGEREAPVRPLFYGGKRARLRGVGAFHRKAFRGKNGRKHRRVVGGGATRHTHPIVMSSFVCIFRNTSLFFTVEISFAIWYNVDKRIKSNGGKPIWQE